jgi:hypothetical protein
MPPQMFHPFEVQHDNEIPGRKVLATIYQFHVGRLPLTAIMLSWADAW